ncbi:MAG: hypothetical protein AVDCRST_MAG73-522 [uncultured Thermomicrobiales bacterium]|uniref:Uncharacterized protein n=1 Tax=uncultured Thermomicrobiales bacterium TaxID=1645740 RepID=A0A6J4TKJ0_9BACT|nr:MAG: hypothetical protein AVDCRST_MAG73-522 [uncultured Thermomicrobiales bacterium]
MDRPQPGSRPPGGVVAAAEAILWPAPIRPVSTPAPAAAGRSVPLPSAAARAEPIGRPAMTHRPGAKVGIEAVPNTVRSTPAGSRHRGSPEPLSPGQGKGARWRTSP